MENFFKVALVGLDNQSVPDSVVTGLAELGIKLVVHECENRARIWPSGRVTPMLSGSWAPVVVCTDK
jgi:hypothetical protein